MISIKLMPEFMCDPIWHDDGAAVGPISPFDLPISHLLAQAVSDWDKRYQETYSDIYPPDSSFTSPEEEERFYHDGEMLVKKLQDELGDNYRVRQHFSRLTKA